MKITIFTDGSAKGNPGPGGWGVIVIDEKNIIELGEGQEYTTNNRMEMSAVINALRYISNFKKDVSVEGDKKMSIEIRSDSQYVIKGITEWIFNWQKKGWVTSAKKDVENKDLWIEMLEAKEDVESKSVKIKWTHIEGHSGIVGNERCDEIATCFADFYKNNRTGEKPNLYNGDIALYPIKII